MCHQYQILEFYQSLQDKSKELLKYAERANLSNQFVSGHDDQSKKNEDNVSVC